MNVVEHCDMNVENNKISW